MAYAKTTWVDNSTPAINATNLNKIEEGIEDAISTAEDTQSSITSLDNNKQDTLVSGSNIATINGNDLTAGGNIEIMFEKLKILNEEIIEVPWSFYASENSTVSTLVPVSYTPVGGADSIIYVDLLEHKHPHNIGGTIPKLHAQPELYRDSNIEGYSSIPYTTDLLVSGGEQLKIFVNGEGTYDGTTFSGIEKIRIVEVG